MSAIITSILTLIEQFLPLLGTSATVTQIGSVIATLSSLLPIVVDEVSTVVPAVKNIIAALSANPATTADQLQQLQALDKQCDDAFDAAAADTDSGV